MRVIITLLVFLAGAALPFQAAVNTRLRQSVGAPLLSALISFLVGASVLTLLHFSGLFGRAKLTGLSSTPWWAWIGGGCGALVVTMAIIGLPRIGAGALVAATVFGQLIASLLLDHFGWLGVPRVPINTPRLLGAMLLFAGVLLMQRK